MKAHFINSLFNNIDSKDFLLKEGLNDLPTNRERILSKVTQWADQSGLKTSLISDTRHDFVMEVYENETLPRLQIIHRGADAAYVLVVGLVNIPEADRKRLKDYNQEMFDEIIWDIKLDLLRAGVDFTVLGSERDPDAWEVQRHVFLNEANIAQFYDAYSRVKNSLIGTIWSYKKALDKLMISEAWSQTETQVMGSDEEAIPGSTDRAQKIMNAIINTSIILMSTLMDGFTQIMMEATGAFASDMAEAMGGEEAREEVDDGLQQDPDEINERMRQMISDVRKDVYDQFEQKRTEIEPFVSDEAFDLGPEIIDRYDFNLPKLTERLDDDALVQYARLLANEDSQFSEMFGELTSWMNNLPKPPEKVDKE